MSTTVRSLPERAFCSLLAFLFEVEPFYSIDGLTPIHAHILSFLSHRRILAYLLLLHRARLILLRGTTSKRHPAAVGVKPELTSDSSLAFFFCVPRQQST